MLQVTLNDKVALVTGATRGIGLSIARCLAKSGAKVACIGTNAQRLEESVAQINAQGGCAKAYVCNVADEEQIDAMSKSVLADFGRVDILVNNAGITRDMLMRRIPTKDWDDVFAINTRGTFLVTRAFVETMRKNKWGRIINLASVSALFGNPGQANYSASKAAIIAFTRTIAKELGNRNITANAIAPGFIETDMTAVLKDVQKQVMIDRTPLGRMGQPEDIANAVLFFASDDASFITGQTLVVDGGLID